MHVSGEPPPDEIDENDDGGDNRVDSGSGRHGGGPECEDEPAAARERAGAGGEDPRRGGSGKHGDGDGEWGGGRWEPGFLEAELRETCLRQLEIPVRSIPCTPYTPPANRRRRHM